MNERLVAAMTGNYEYVSAHASVVLGVLTEGKFADDLLVDLLTTFGTLPIVDGFPTIPGVGLDDGTWGTAVKENKKAVTDFIEWCQSENPAPLAVAERLRGFLDADRVANIVRLGMLMHSLFPYVQRPAEADDAAGQLEGVTLEEMNLSVMAVRPVIKSVMLAKAWTPSMTAGAVARLIAREKDPKKQAALLITFVGQSTLESVLPVMVVIERVKKPKH